MHTEIKPEVRLPTVAGQFYDADPTTLRRNVQTFLKTAPAPDDQSEHPSILILPHAGYRYSGLTAAAGVRWLQSAQRIILVGVSHRDLFDKAALWSGLGWQTPLGCIPVDCEAVESLIMEADDVFEINNLVHRQEHGLEVELPFLQTQLGDFKLVPVLLSGLFHEVQLHRLAQILANHMNSETLMVVSSDLSHYPTGFEGPGIDRRTINGILSGDVATFQRTVQTLLNEEHKGLSTCACGAVAIELAMLMARALELGDRRLLHYSGSTEVSGDPSQTHVGYAAIGFFNN